MDILDIVAGRNAAVVLVNELTGKVAGKEPYAWDKLDNVRNYLRTSTVAEVNDYFTKERQ